MGPTQSLFVAFSTATQMCCATTETREGGKDEKIREGERRRTSASVWSFVRFEAWRRDGGGGGARGEARAGASRGGAGTIVEGAGGRTRARRRVPRDPVAGALRSGGGGVARGSKNRGRSTAFLRAKTHPARGAIVRPGTHLELLWRGLRDVVGLRGSEEGGGRERRSRARARAPRSAARTRRARDPRVCPTLPWSKIEVFPSNPSTRAFPPLYRLFAVSIPPGECARALSERSRTRTESEREGAAQTARGSVARRQRRGGGFLGRITRDRREGTQVTGIASKRRVRRFERAGNVLNSSTGVLSRIAGRFFSASSPAA